MKKIQRKNITEDEFNNFINEAYALKQKCKAKMDNSNYEDKDARRIIFQSLYTYIQNFHFNMIFSKSLMDIGFYEKNFGNASVDETSMRNVFENYIGGALDSLLVSTFTQVENYLRIIAKHKNIDDRYISTTLENLFKEFSLNPDNLELWKIISNVRNSMHNGGFFDNKKDIININYKGTNYEFIKNSPVNYRSISDVLFFVNELLDSLISELNEKSNTESYIEHNYANLVIEEEGL